MNMQAQSPEASLRPWSPLRCHQSYRRLLCHPRFKALPIRFSTEFSIVVVEVFDMFDVVIAFDVLVEIFGVSESFDSSNSFDVLGELDSPVSLGALGSLDVLDTPHASFSSSVFHGFSSFISSFICCNSFDGLALLDSIESLEAVGVLNTSSVFDEVNSFDSVDSFDPVETTLTTPNAYIFGSLFFPTFTTLSANVIFPRIIGYLGSGRSRCLRYCLLSSSVILVVIIFETTSF
ncbi:hypothetical protein F5878DRAFT_221691 [Lentinula raphanica]|uniref:Uncharacterized protein n=1 Tax=Lentinula raphanica TaxID=153919 RepID=A0AA38UCQ0_9AGAR|nr:hypothetical protein F5878DRAFT_221691 [Lentinula raphanica]